MLSDHDEALARGAFAPVRDIEPDEDLVARVVAQVGRRKKASPRFALAPTRPRLALQALAALALLGAALYSVPPTRAAIEGAGKASAASSPVGSAASPPKPPESRSARAKKHPKTFTRNTPPRNRG